MNYDMELYSKSVEKFIVTEPKNRLMENILGLGEESGEVQGKIKRLIRDKSFSKSDVIKELGDCLFYVTAIANYLDSNLQEVANANMKKLHDREKRNKIKGSGDNR